MIPWPWRRRPLVLPSYAEHARVMRQLNERVRQAEAVEEEMALWPAPLAVIRAACGTGPAVEYPELPKPVAPAYVGLGGGLTMEELCRGLAMIASGTQAAIETFGELGEAVEVACA